ncbi:AraC family transcriptional regulator [Sporosarcina sp. FSL K6-3457]|uniref:AraC family transcriptional regulator n=1 Tax=Sporosarcina sp. FSL K6-3457 TaxID=2978204 RepID=UPI0030F72E2D
MHNHVLLWNNATIKVLDVRYSEMVLGERMLPHRLPASAFLFAMNGSAKITLDGVVQLATGFHVLHGGKGMSLDIIAEGRFEYYLIFYRAKLPQSSSKKLIELMKHDNPFQLQYGFSPHSPLSLFEMTNLMDKEWQQESTLEKFHVKVLFYRLVHEIHRQLYDQGIETTKPDFVSQAVHYIHERYNEPITLESIAEALNYNMQYLSRQFKRQTGRSPIAYLLEIRIEKAQELLLHTNATVQEIADYVGYTDPLYFSRLFKKHTGVTPGNFKKHMPGKKKVSVRPYSEFKLSIVDQNSMLYSNDGIDNHYHYEDEGDLLMHKRTKTPMVATLFLCFSLLLSACTGGSSQTNRDEQAPTTQAVAETQSTKVVTTIFGDVEIPTKPERIVAVQYLSSLLALGITPIGSTERTMESPYFEEMTTGIDVIGSSAEDISFEKITDLEPDVIILMTSDEEVYKKYNKIAPTVSIPYGSLENAQKEINFFGELLGLENEAKTWIEDYEERITAAKAKVEQVIPNDATFTILEHTDKALSLYGDNYGRGGLPIYQGLGRKIPAKYEEEIVKEGGYLSLSIEVLADYAGDYIILTSDKTLEEYKADPVWGTLDAVKNNKVYIWPNKRSYFIDPLSLLAQTEELAEWLSGQK